MRARRASEIRGERARAVPRRVVWCGDAGGPRSDASTDRRAPGGGVRRPAGELASHLATHFECGQGYRKAGAYHRLAAEAAVRRHAGVEAIDHLSRALSLLATFPDGPERSHLELEVLAALGPALTAVKGPDESEVQLISRSGRSTARRSSGGPSLARRGLRESGGSRPRPGFSPEP